ncbi:MAG: 3-isopropylmalate dehydrogenase [Ignavibacteria bacterium]|jgi:3-isopropylmalate dehydrogenase|nr:3-isopropylmalate dehydrogenase [Ignavibacteria bacterium]MCU7502126.1 3-isopropylmalate dehydrogenase [Ignavibacteria bacterium]MCU7515528.1 3-isopropylmalate dehydrogenase [Ignavibacteria bacterium]
MSFKIMLLPGDGIGPDIVSSAVKVMKLVAGKMSIPLEFSEGLMGGCSYEKYGTPLSEGVLAECKASDAVLLGAVGGPKWESLPHNLKPEAALLRIRKELGLFANIRPAKVYDSLVESSSLKAEVVKGTDFIVVRELTGGIYFGQPRGFNETRGWNTMEYSRPEVERIARIAFEMARSRNKKVTSVDKANVLEVSQLWRTVVHEIHKDYQDVALSDLYVDNAAMQIVKNPKQFDVIVTGNLFGDILSDISGMITGSLGMLPSASMGTRYALYEPIHGSAPDIAGQNKANPLATIASGAMLFAHSLKNAKASAVINEAIEEVLSEGFRTADIFSEGSKLLSTTEMTEAVLEKTEKILSQKESVL